MTHGTSGGRSRSDGRRVKHLRDFFSKRLDEEGGTYHSDTGTERAWGEVAPELGLRDAVVSVWAGDTSVDLRDESSDDYDPFRESTHPQITRTFEPCLSVLAL